MQLESIAYRSQSGWSAALPGALDGPDTLVLVFGAPSFAREPAALQQLAAAFPRSLLLGCSTSGEIAGDQLEDESLSVAVARFEHTRLQLEHTLAEPGTDSFDAGADLAARLADRSLRAVFVLSDGLAVNGSRLAEGLSRHLGPDVVVTGALAGDGSDFARTWVLDRAQPQARRICALGLYGDRLRIGHGCDGGWHDFGPERRITRADGNVLYELDGKPALDLYKTYLGDRAAGLPGTALLFPLAVRPQADSEPLVRTILGIDEARRAMTFAGDVPEGGIARLMRASAEQLIDSAARAAREAALALEDCDATLAISVSCVGRRLLLGGRTEEEVETVADVLPAGAVHVGMYSYGEIAPPAAGARSQLHNQTMTVTVLGES